MFEWKVEEMKLLQERPIIYTGKDFPFTCESTTTKEDKIQFIDSITDGKMTYVINLVEKFIEDEILLTHNKYGGINTNSLIAWIRKNDTRNMVDKHYNYGQIWILGNKRYITRLVPTEKLYYDSMDDFIDDIFHSALLSCRREEIEYYKSHDEYEVLKEKFRNRKYNTTFGVHISSWSSGKICVIDDNDDNNEREITIDELKLILEKQEELDNFIQKLSSEINIKY